MVAGVAHEINNPVNFIHGNLTPATQYAQEILGLLELYQQHYPNPPEDIQDEIEAVDLEFLKEDFLKMLNSMKQGTQRIREIVLSLRNFSRLDEAQFKAVDIHEGIDSTLMILQHRLKAKPNFPEIEIVKEYATLPLIDCYPSQLNQVFMNIQVTLSTLYDRKNLFLPLKSKFIPYYSTITESPFIFPITVPESLLIFNPNCSIHSLQLKKLDACSGLGLSISYQIVVNKHGGNLSCKSIHGVGTEFVIEIPVTQIDSK